MSAGADGQGGPLAGVRVLELAGIGPGPHAAMLLADLGADVVRVERPGADGLGLPAADPATQVLNRGRRSVVLDLKHPEALDALRRLVDAADVLIEGYRPGVAERLGAGPDECLARNPRLVYARMTGWGQTGPLARTAGHDIGYIARTGALSMLGPAGGPPVWPANLLGDFGGGSLFAAFGICAALVERASSGRGQVVDVAIVDGTAALLAMHWMLRATGVNRDERGVNWLDGGVPWYGVYETSDGGWMAVGALEAPFYAELLRVLAWGDAPDRGDPGVWPELRDGFAARFRTRTRAEWVMAFAGTDACVEPVLSLPEALEDPHLSARATYAVVDGVPQPAPAPRFDRTPGALGRPPSSPGAHTLEALRDWGVTDPQRLVDSGAAVQRAPTSLTAEPSPQERHPHA